MIDINTLKFDEKGLIPAIVVDNTTKEVLTLAYMNKESLQITLDKKKTCFFCFFLQYNYMFNKHQARKMPKVAFFTI